MLFLALPSFWLNNMQTGTATTWALRLLTDSRYYWHLFSLIFLGEVALCAVVIRYVACEPHSTHLPA